MIEQELNGVQLRVYTNGKIESFYNYRWRELGASDCRGYCVVNIKYKSYKKHRIVYWAWNSHKFDIHNPKQMIDHKNRNPLDNRLCNLDVVTNQQNLFNSNAKGYCWNKQMKKWQSYIIKDDKNKHLGYFDTEDEARNAYLKAKNELHLIKGRTWT